MASPPSDLDRHTSIIDLDRPNPARIDNALLGGGYNFAADRRAAAALMAADPTVARRLSARGTILRRITSYALDAGIRQFVHLGCGIPFPGGIHTVVQRRQVAGRVVYVDDDPTVIDLICRVAGADPTITAMEADPVGGPATVLDEQRIRWLIDENTPALVLSTRLSCQALARDGVLTCSVRLRPARILTNAEASRTGWCPP
ncbi:MAG: hypothetical protein HKP61_21435 [Dactylosporangium sp.]|nr:hypothetical protein [Dactylosporangium sp.]